MGDMDDVLKEFLVESYENLDRLDQDLVELEKNPGDKQIISSIFRTIHTIKGTSGFFGFNKLESVAHVGENLLSRLREGELVITPEIASALLALVDAVRKMLGVIEETGAEGSAEYKDLVATLTRLNEGKKAAASAPAAKPAEALAKSEAPKPEAAPAEAKPLGALLVESGAATQSQVDKAIVQQHSGDPRHIGEILVEQGAVQSEDVKDALMAQQEHAKGTVSESNIRVDVGLLDKLMNLVGELVLARNQILQFNATQEDSSFHAASQRLNLVTTELQEGVMKTRMQPIGNIWNKFPRVVRDLSNMCGKQVELEMDGRETELDKTIIEAIKDPLTHVVRNCIDHGIEAPAVRAAKGKPATGRVFMRAFHEGGQVNIEIHDDGGGIDIERVKRKALDRGLINQDQSLHMSDREALNLIFLPGFSTAEKITNVSGRGVGMDVVKTNVERIGGTVDIQSKVGEGTTLKIKIPLTLAIIPALIVVSGGDRYAIPQVSLLELVRLEGEEAQKDIEMIHGAPVYRLRGNLLPLVRLNDELKVQNLENADCINIVVLQADNRQFGLVVDSINDTEEIVVKPLGKILKGISTFAGATIMGDGRVALILDIMGIAQRASIISTARNRPVNDSHDNANAKSDDAQTLLLFRVGKQGRMALPLSEVARLEEFKSSSIERCGEQEVVQYRSQIMPLVHLTSLINEHEQSLSGESAMQVIVHSAESRCIGLVVSQILDIVKETVVVKSNSHRRGVKGSVVVQGKVTELLDLAELHAMAEIGSKV